MRAGQELWSLPQVGANLPIEFYSTDELPDTVVAALAQQADRTVVLINYSNVDLMSPTERTEMLSRLFAALDRPTTPRHLDELASRRNRSAGETLSVPCNASAEQRHSVTSSTGPDGRPVSITATA